MNNPKSFRSTCFESAWISHFDVEGTWLVHHPTVVQPPVKLARELQLLVCLLLKIVRQLLHVRVPESCRSGIRLSFESKV